MSEDRVLRIERHIAATPEEVFDAWTVPERLAAGWGPEGVTIPEYEMDVREGGRWRTVMKSSNSDLNIVSGVYHELRRPERLIFSWAWEQEDGTRGHETEVTVVFVPDGNGTKMVFLQKIFADTKQCDLHNQGWTSSFECLNKLFV